MKKIILWIFCLSADKDGIREDTIWNIEAAVRYLRAYQPDPKTILIMLTGDIRLLVPHSDNGKMVRKEWTVPERMWMYIKDNYPEEFETYFRGNCILETESVVSRQNIPMSLALIPQKHKQNQGFCDPATATHVLCSETWHLRTLTYLLRHWIEKCYGVIVIRGGSQLRAEPSQQKILGVRGRLVRWWQQLHIRINPRGDKSWDLIYRWKLHQRSQYRTKQT